MATFADDEPGGFGKTDQVMLEEKVDGTDDEDEKMEDVWEGHKSVRVKWTFLGPKTADETANAFGELAATISSHFHPTKFVNNNSKLLKTKNWSSNPNQIKHHFKIHQDTRSKHPRHYILHDMFTQVSLSTIKQENTVREILQCHRIYGEYHEFETEEWDIARVGFFHKAHINHITAQYLSDHLRKLIMDSEPANLTAFQIAPTRVRFGKNRDDNI